MPARERLAYGRQSWLLIAGLWCLLAVVVGGFAASEVNQWKRQAQVRAKVAATYARHVFEEADDIAKWMASLVQDRGVGSDEAFRRLTNTQQVHEALANRIAHSPEIAVASFVDLQGHLTSFSRFWPAVVDLSDRDYVAFMRSGTSDEVFISAPVQNKVTSGWNVFLARRIKGAAGDVIGLAIVGLKLDQIAQFFRETSISDKSVVSIFRYDKVLLVNDAVSDPARHASWGRRFERLAAFNLLTPDGGTLPPQLTTNTERLTGRLGFPYRIIAVDRLERFPAFASTAIDGSVFSERPLKLVFILGIVGFLLSTSIVFGARARSQLVEVSIREQQNASNESLLKSLTELSEDKSAVLSSDGTRIIYENQAFQMIAGHPNGPVSLSKLTEDVAVKAFFSDPGKAPLDTVVVFENKEVPGQFRFLHVAAQVAQLGSIGDCVVMVVRDETSQREQQSIAAQSTKMIVMGQMAAGIAHEINQPLNVIRMASENAQHFLGQARSSPGDVEPIDAADRKLTRVLGQVERMEAIISRMRDHVRKPSMVDERFPVAAAIGRAVALVPFGTRAGVGIVVESVDPSLEFTGQATILEQVIVNLLLNSVSALSVGKIANPKVIIQVQERPGGRVAIRVSDNGPGVPVALSDRIFEPFFTTKKLGHGTGLGLFLSAHWVKEVFGGALSLVTSAPGKGTTFEIVLPRAAPGAMTAIVRG